MGRVLGPGAIVLAEGSVHERLRRRPDVPFDPQIGVAALVFDGPSRELLERVHRGYVAIGASHGLPMLVQTDTWRASGARIAASAWAGTDVNRACVSLARDVAGAAPGAVLVAGLLGPAGDAYDPDAALGRDDARRYHAEQADALADAGSDLLLCATLPALSEAIGLAEAMAATGLPAVVSFVVRRSGTLLDGTPLDDAIGMIDDIVDPAPIGYMLNCVHPRVLGSALEACPAAVARVIGLQANTSAREPEELDGLAELETAEPEHFAHEIAAAGRSFGLRVLGGCCGTGEEHIAALARLLAAG